MSDYTKIPTSAEVWAVIRARHPDLQVFETFSNPDGYAFGGNGTHGEMVTVYGFRDSELPLIGARTTWDIAHLSDGSTKRMEEKHEYWLCAFKRGLEED